MNKEVISDWQAISILILFMSSTSTVQMVALSAGGDFWLAIILSVLVAGGIALVFGQLHAIFPQKDYFEICEACCGKVIGKIICILYIHFAFDEGVLVLTNAKQFITETKLADTPETITIIPLMIICVWAVKEGVEVIGRWSKYTVIMFICFIFTLIMLLIPQMDVNNLQPIFYKGSKPVFEATLTAFAFPFGEIVMLAMIFSHFKTKKSAYKVYLIGLSISGILSFLVAATTVLVLGVDIALASYFPVYNATGVINIGNIIQRLEVIAVLIGGLGAFLKNSILVLVICKGIKRILNISDYRFIVVPVSLLMIVISNFWVDSRMAYVNYNAEAWSYYAIVFEAFIPIIILIIAKIRQKGSNNIRVNG